MSEYDKAKMAKKGHDLIVYQVSRNNSKGVLSNLFSNRIKFFTQLWFYGFFFQSVSD